MAPNGDISLLVECLGKFQTHNLDANWLQITWNGDHSQMDYLPPEFEESHQDTVWPSVLRETSAAVRDFVVRNKPNDENAGKDKPEDQEDDAASFWINLVENGISFKGIIIVTGCFMERGCGRKVNFKDSETALQAASLYLCLVCLPGSKAFRLFHPVLYAKAVELFSVIKRFGGVGKEAAPSAKRKRTGGKSALPRKQGKTLAASRKRSGSGDRGGNESYMEESTSDTEGEEFALTNQEVKLLSRSLCLLLLDLKLLLGMYALKDYDQALEHTVQHLSEFFNSEGRFKMDNWNTLLPGVRTCLLTLCTPYHGVVETSVDVVLKSVSCSVLEYGSRSAINFVGQLVNGIPDGRALPGLRKLVQGLCLKVPERADARGKVATVVLALLENVPHEAFLSLIQWFLLFMRNVKVNFRIFALEVVALVLCRSPGERPLAGIPADVLRKLADGCLKAVLLRCSDSAATVRSKALTIFANCVVAGNSLAYLSVMQVFLPGSTISLRTDAAPGRKGSVSSSVIGSPQISVSPTSSPQVSSSGTDSPEKQTQPRRPIPNFDTTTEDSDSEESGRKTNRPEPVANPISLLAGLPNSKFVMELMRYRAADKKVHVRKAAIQVLQKGMELAVDCLTIDNIESLQGRCLDTSILVKKQSMQALTTILLTYPMRNVLQQAWMNGVLPSIVDPENSVQEKCAEMIDEVLLKHIAAHPQSKSRFHSMFWMIMNEIASNENHLLTAWRFIKRAMFVMAASGKLRKNLVNLLQSHIDTENDLAAWLLLSGLACTVEIRNPDFAFAYWDVHQDELSKRSKSLTNVLLIMAATCKKLDHSKAKKYFDNLSNLLEELSCSYKLVSSLVEAIDKLNKALVDKKFKPKMPKVYGSVFKKCDQYLSSVFLNEDNKANAIDEDTLITHLAAGAEVAMICPKLSSERICLILKCILAAKCGADEAVEKKDTPTSQRLVKFNTGVMSHRLKNYAIVALGKLCLQRESLAKECTPALGRILENSTDPAARNNIVVILVDLCIRYTTMVDPYFPSVTACLKDPSFMVRKQTLSLLTHLLQEDYIKWRGSLFFCFITAVIDPSKAIREFTKHAILHILTKRHPTMLFQHFVECLFFFNAYQDHEAYNKIAQSETEAKLFAMEGERNMSMRMILYRFMLENMADEHRFQITAKLCSDILGGVLNGVIKLKRSNGDPCKKGHTLVKDTLAILCCDEIKLATLRGSTQEELEESDVAAAAVATVKKTIITQMVKRNVIENIMPIIIGLKHKLEKLLSPLTKDLMLYLKELTKDFKVEVKEILSEDKQLAAEVEYDLKKLEQQQAEEQRKAKRADAHRRDSISEKRTMAGNMNQNNRDRSAAPPLLPRIAANLAEREAVLCVENGNEMESFVDAMAAPAAPTTPLDSKVPMLPNASNVPETRPRLVPRRNSQARSRGTLDVTSSNLPAASDHKLSFAKASPGNESLNPECSRDLSKRRPTLTARRNSRAELSKSSLDVTMQPVVQIQRLDSSVLQNKSMTAANDSKVLFYTERMAETVVYPPASQQLGPKVNAAASSNVGMEIPVLRLTRLDDSPVPQPTTETVAPKIEPLSPNGEMPATPNRPQLHEELMRAISTPCGVITDITFGNVPGPLSPIVDTHRQQMLLHLTTPDRAPSQRRWNVVPPPKPVPLPTVSEDEDEERSGSR